MSLPDFAQVLIVGGGPTGLVLALALHKHGCPDIVVVDALTQGENTSRAVAIHAATIEAFEEFGVADGLVNAGQKVLRSTAWFGRTAPIDTAYFPPLAKYTKYPFVLALPQHITEKALAAQAQERGIKVYRRHKVVDLKPNAEDHTLTDVIFDNGHVLRTRFIAGADGSRSTIRPLVNVGWADPSGQADVKNKDEAAFAHMYVADVLLANPPPFPQDSISMIASSGSPGVLFIRLPDTSYPGSTEPAYRIAGAIHPSLGSPPDVLDTEYLQELLDAWGPNQVLPIGSPHVEISKTLWASRFRAHSAIADRFFTHVPPRDPNGPKGCPVVLLGDAAHIHPPLGGQGMNLGVRDGVRLAPLLTAYMRAASAPSSAAERDKLEAPLKAWAAERRARALAVIGAVKGLQRIVEIEDRWKWFLGIIPYNPARLRNAFMRFVTSFEWWRARVAYQLSGLGNR